MILTNMAIQQEARELSTSIGQVRGNITGSTRASDSEGDERDATGL